MRRQTLEQPWPRSLAEARLLQERLRGQVVTEDQLSPVQRVAGVDAHYDVDRLWAAIVVMTFADLVIVESALINRPLAFPYLPGLLSFREAPAILDVLHRLSDKPDLLLVDGQGLAHPRRFGLACHVGVLGDVPTIGVAKSRLVGTYQEPGIERGAWSELTNRGETIGAVLRTRSAVRPVFVSIGHRISLKTAIDLVLRCTGHFRLPEPIRAADALSRQHLVPGIIDARNVV
ncbi:MAG: deoxyribonuclease V [Steroidobacteraceae bacterium]|jgi:deoxyribonuclease V